MKSVISPEFVELIQRSSILIEESIKGDNDKLYDTYNNQHTVTNNNNNNNSDAYAQENNEDDDISVEDLVECLLEGNTIGVEEYLDTLPIDIREEKQKQIKLVLSLKQK